MNKQTYINSQIFPKVLTISGSKGNRSICYSSYATHDMLQALDQLG